MATVHCDRAFSDRFDGSESRFNDPLTLADAEHSAAVTSGLGGNGFTTSSAARPASKKRLHRIAEVRQRQGVTLRNVARRLGMSLPVVRRQEQADCDLRLSDLQRWQEVLEVPVAELLEEGEGQLSGPVLERSRMVKLMKTVAAIRERTQGHAVERMVTMLVEQVLEIMPELSDVTPWHSVGQRRTLDDVGRTARMTISEDMIRQASRS